MTETPTAAEVRRGRKADLVAWSEALGLSTEGKVDELRERLLERIAAAPKVTSPKPEKSAPATSKEPDSDEGPIEAEGETAAEETTEEEEEAEEEDEGEKPFKPKRKPELSEAVRRMLDVRREVAARRPRFLRQEWFTRQRLGMKWRKPTGNHTKLRRHFGYRPNVVSIGFRGPKAVRGLHPSGFREVLVHTVQELDELDARIEAARIAGGVGTRRRTEIQAAADEKGIRVLNRRAEE